MKFLRLIGTLVLLLIAGAPADSQKYLCCLLTSPLTGNPIGSGVDFSTKTSALYVLPTTSIQNNAPWSIAMGITMSNLPTSQVEIVDSNPGNPSAGGSGFRLSNFINASDAAFSLQGYIRPYPTGTTCAINSATCARYTRFADGNRHWWVWTFDGTTAQLYIDNVLTDVSIPASQAFVPSTAYWQIGSPGVSLNVTEFAFYSVALNSTNIGQLYSYNSNSLSPTSGTLTQNRLIYFPTGAGNCNSTGCTDTSGSSPANNGIFDTTTPSVAVTAPTNGATITGSQNLTATCTDTIQCVSVQWQLDGVLLSTQTTAPYTYAWNSANYVDGSHVITALATNVGGLTATASVTVTTSNGVSAQSYYFALAGSDSNDCKSTGTACQTIAKANTLTYHGGDSLLFNAGDTFPITSVGLKICGAGVGGCTQNTFPGGTSYPLTISTYGGGTCTPAAGVRTGCANFTLDPASLVVVGVEIAALANTTLSKFVITGGTAPVLGPSVTAPGIFLDIASPNMTVTSNEVVDFVIGIYWDGGSGNITGTISNNYVHGSTPSATIDTGIWCRFSGCTSVTIGGNLVQNIGGHASGVVPGGSGNPILIADGASHVTSQFNVTTVFGANITTCGGPAGNWAFNASFITFQFNESYGGGTIPLPPVSGCDWDAFDLDGGVSNSIVRANYGHDNFGAGMVFFVSAVGTSVWGSNSVYENILENNGLTGNGGCLYISSANTSTNSSFYNNSCYENQFNGNDEGVLIAINGNNDIKVINNLLMGDSCSPLIQTFPTTLNPSSMIFNGNNYWRGFNSTSCSIALWGNVSYTTIASFRTGTGQEANGNAVDPLTAGEVGTITASYGASSTLVTSTGTSFTVAGTVTGFISTNDTLTTQACIPSSTVITGQTSGPTGGAGTYTTNNATTCSAVAVTTSSKILNVTSVSGLTGSLAVGQVIQPGASISQPIASQIAGTAGGVGQYGIPTLFTFQRITSRTMAVYQPGGTCYPGSAVPAGPQNQPSGCPSPYSYQASSPMIGVGVDVNTYGLTRPTVDYYGNTVPNGVGTGWNIGADGAHH